MDVNERFQLAIKKRDTLRGKLERLQGRKESAQARLTEVESSCRAKNIDPAQIDSLIEKVGEVLKSRVEALEVKLLEADSQLAPYLALEKE
jgi:predicted nuclease with TOPRIM domain